MNQRRVEAIRADAPYVHLVTRRVIDRQKIVVAAITEQVRRRVLRWFARSGLLEPAETRDMRGWAHGGFSLDAAVRIAGPDRAGLERLLRYCARPPFALERLEQILLALGEPPRPPPISPARGPPAWDETPESEPDCDLLAQPEPELEFDQRITW